MSEHTTKADSVENNDPQQRVLVLTPFGHDARVVCRVLADAGLDPLAVSEMAELRAAMEHGAAAALVAEEALTPATRDQLSATLQAQPTWSDFPLILLISQHRSEKAGWRMLHGIEGTAQLTLLERPVHTVTLVSTIRAAVESRRRQYQVRDELAARQRAEAALRESEERFRVMADYLPLMVWVHDAQGRQDFVNETFCEFFGVSREQMRDEHWQALIHPDEGQAYAEEFRACVREQRVFHGEVRVRRADGQWRWLESWGRPRFNTQGQFLGHVGASADVTERKQAEETLRQREEQLRVALSAGQMGTWAWDLVNETVTTDTVLRELWDLPGNDAEIPQQQILARVHPDDLPSLYTPKEIAEQTEPFHREFRIVRSDGEVRWMAAFTTPLREEDGSVRRVIGVNFDVTQRQRAEAALRELNENLEAQVAERSAVAEQRAQTLQRLAAELSEAEHRERTRLAKVLHDELQQLLVAVRYRLPDLARGSEEQRKESLAKVDELLKTCLSTSRNLSHELSPPVLQQGTLTDVMQWLSQWFAEKYQLTIHVEPLGELPRVPEHLQVFLFQAAREFLFNVVKHSEELTAWVRLSSGQGNLNIEVEDAGKNFDSQAVAAHLQQPDSLGLFNVKERLEALRGRLEVERGLGGGGLFRIVLPLAESTAQEDSQAEEPIAEEQSSQIEEVIRLLVVDDHPVVREGFVMLLNKDDNLQVVGEAENGEQAIQQAQTLRPDVIVMDINMPKMDGIEATRRIKQILPEIDIVALSLHEEDSGPSRAIAAAGASAFVSKYAPYDDFLEAIRKLRHPGTKPC